MTNMDDVFSDGDAVEMLREIRGAQPKQEAKVVEQPKKLTVDQIVTVVTGSDTRFKMTRKERAEAKLVKQAVEQVDPVLATEHRCRGCKDYLRLEEIGWCSACSHERTKKNLARVQRKADPKDPKVKVVSKAAIEKQRKWALKKLGVLDPCQRQLGRRKCGIAKGEHGSFPPLLPNGCCGWTNQTAAEQREAKLVLVKKAREERKAAREAKALEKSRLEWRKKIEESQAKRAARKAECKMEKRHARLLLKQGEMPEALGLLEILADDAQPMRDLDADALNTLVQLKLVTVDAVDTKLATITKSGARLVRAVAKREALAKEKARKEKNRAQRKVRRAAKTMGDSSVKEKNVIKSKSKKSAKKQSKAPKQAMPKVGTKLEHTKRGGKSVTAVVVKDGVKFEGEVYKSLSGAARAAAKKLKLTTSQNGFLFWGVSKNGK